MANINLKHNPDTCLQCSFADQILGSMETYNLQLNEALLLLIRVAATTIIKHVDEEDRQGVYEWYGERFAEAMRHYEDLEHKGRFHHAHNH